MSNVKNTALCPIRTKVGRSLRTGIMALMVAAMAPLLSAQQQAAPPAQQQGQPSPEQIQQINQLQAQLHQINARIQAAQQQAHQNEAVRNARVAYEEVLKEAMVEQDPGIAQVLEQRESLLSKIMDSPELSKAPEERSPEFMQELQQYQALEQRIQPVAEEVSDEAKVARSLDNYQGKLIKEMEKVDEETPQLLEARDNIVQQYQQIVQAAGQ